MLSGEIPVLYVGALSSVSTSLQAESAHAKTAAIIAKNDFLIISNRPLANWIHGHMRHSPVAISAVGLDIHALHGCVDRRMAIYAVLSYSVTIFLMGRNWQVNATDIVVNIRSASHNLERNFGHQGMWRMAFVAGQIGMDAHFLGPGRLLHDMAGRAELALICIMDAPGEQSRTDYAAN